MKPPLYVRPLTDVERDALKAGLRSSNAFTLRRSQVLLASARGTPPPFIARQFGCATQTVRNAIRDFNRRGLAALEEGSHRNVRNHATFDDATLTELHTLAHRSPRDFGHATGLWTLELLATESARQRLTAHRVIRETIRCAILRLGSSWKRAKHWITSPDPAYLRKKATRLADSGYAAASRLGPWLRG